MSSREKSVVRMAENLGGSKADYALAERMHRTFASVVRKKLLAESKGVKHRASIVVAARHKKQQNARATRNK